MDLNHTVLTGCLKRDPITKCSDSGTSHVTFTLEVMETNSTGASFTLFVPAECYGDAADTAGALRAGDHVLCAGKLKWTSYTAKDGSKRSTLCVLARIIKRLALAGGELASTAHSHGAYDTNGGER